jgi:hypothetical protein
MTVFNVGEALIKQKRLGKGKYLISIRRIKKP